MNFFSRSGHLDVVFFVGDMHIAAERAADSLQHRRAAVGAFAPTGGGGRGDAADAESDDSIAAVKCKFDRVFLSNVPDYTGFLVALVRFLPLLKEGHGILVHNVMLTTLMFQNIDQYVPA